VSSHNFVGDLTATLERSQQGSSGVVRRGSESRSRAIAPRVRDVLTLEALLEPSHLDKGQVLDQPEGRPL
jgi:hypothetical protein